MTDLQARAEAAADAAVPEDGCYASEADYRNKRFIARDAAIRALQQKGPSNE